MFSERLLRSIKSYQCHAGRGGAHVFLRRMARLRWIFWSIVTQSDIHPAARISFDLKLPHPNGVVVHENAVIGRNCMIMQQVTIGMIRTGEVPTIGDDVYIGAGAKLIGKLTVGDGARIGANAVVLNDVPAHHTAVGNPARLIARPGPEPVSPEH